MEKGFEGGNFVTNMFDELSVLKDGQMLCHNLIIEIIQ